MCVCVFFIALVIITNSIHLEFVCIVICGASHLFKQFLQLTRIIVVSFTLITKLQWTKMTDDSTFGFQDNCCIYTHGVHIIMDEAKQKKKFFCRIEKKKFENLYGNILIVYIHVWRLWILNLNGRRWNETENINKQHLDISMVPRPIVERSKKNTYTLTNSARMAWNIREMGNQADKCVLLHTYNPNTLDLVYGEVKTNGTNMVRHQNLYVRYGKWITLAKLFI